MSNAKTVLQEIFEVDKTDKKNPKNQHSNYQFQTTLNFRLTIPNESAVKYAKNWITPKSSTTKSSIARYYSDMRQKS